MKRVLPVIVLVLTALTTVAAQDEADHTMWMKQVDNVSGHLRKELKAKASDDAAGDANKVAEIFGQVEQFWRKRNAGDAVNFAADSASGYKQVASLASAGKFNEASAVLKSTQANCSGCHKAHRSATLLGWKLK